MTVVQWILLGVGFAGCLGVSAFLSGMEAGLTEVSRLRLRRLARGGNKKAIRFDLLTFLFYASFFFGKFL